MNCRIVKPKSHHVSKSSNNMCQLDFVGATKCGRLR